MASSNAFDGLDVTTDEVQRIEKALKNEEFRKLFVEYAQEISDPENRRKYEEELAELERSRGMDVKFLHPKPGYVLKTSINGDKKAFINICTNENVGKPMSEKSLQGKGSGRQVGIQWSVPYSLAPGRDDIDHAGKRCVVYDCMFHPDCFEQINKDGRFRTLMESTALDGIEREFQVKLDRNNVKKPKMKFKGRPQATIIRTPNKDGPAGENSLDALDLQYPYHESKGKDLPNGTAKSASKISGNRKVEAKRSEITTITDEKRNGFTQPKYSIVHRGHFDMQQFTFARDSMPSTRPQELIVKVELPLLKSAAPVQLDVFERRLFLECKKPVSYRLDLPLPFPVDEDKGSAKFDKSKACLIITLAVLPPEIPKLPSTIPEATCSETKSLVEEIVAKIDTSDDCSLRTNGNVSMETDVERDEKLPADNQSSETDNDELVVELECTVEDEEQPSIAMPCKTISPADGDSSTMPTNSEHLGEHREEEAEQDVREAIPCLSEPCQKDVKSSSNMQSTTTSIPKSDTTILPCYDFYQSDERVTLIIREANINSESVMAEDGGRVMKIAFRKATDVECGNYDSGLRMTYDIVVECKEGQSLDEDVKTDVSDVNAVVTMRKKEGCGSLWSGLRVGVSIDTLQEERFLTQESLEEVLAGVLMEQPKREGTATCSVTEFSTESVKAEFEVTSDVVHTHHETTSSQELSQPAEVISKATESIIPALDLGPTADRDDDSSPNSDSQYSSPTSSLPPGLKSALRSPRRRACKSVSFSEEVLVEMFLEGPNRHQKGGNKKKKGRRSPYFGPRRMIEKLKDNSWESYSDSELLRRNGGSTEEEEDDQDHEQEGTEWNWKPGQVLMRQSSSESESGPDVPSSPRTKGKKSKGSRRRRKEKARREASLTASNGDEIDDTNENGADPSPIGDIRPIDSQEMSLESEHATGDNGDDGCDNVLATAEPSGDVSDEKNNNHKQNENNENEELPLEMQNHKTKCAFEFSNQVIFDLDE